MSRRLKDRKTTTPEQGQPRRRGRKAKELLAKAATGAEPAPADPQAGVPQAGEAAVQGDRGRDEQAPPWPAQNPALAQAERALLEKYPHVNIVPGTLRPGSAEGWGAKRIVTIHCANCNQPRILATSDLHHVAHCVACAKVIKKAAKKAGKGGKE